jgi:hypothetical protein
VLTENAAALLEQLADWLPMFVREAAGSDEDRAIERLRVATRKAMGRLEANAGEAKREQRSWLAEGPDPDPLARTCMRLRNDLVILSRIAHDRSALPLHPELAPALEAASKEAGTYMRAAAAALRHRSPPPSLADFEAAVESYEKAIAAARERSLTRALPGVAVGRLFAVGFALEQIRKNFLDLADRIAELQPSARGKIGSALPKEGNI